MHKNTYAYIVSCNCGPCGNDSCLTTYVRKYLDLKVYVCVLCVRHQVHSCVLVMYTVLYYVNHRVHVKLRINNCSVAKPVKKNV